MNTERKEEIRREDKKWGWRFGLIILASAVAGAFIGIGLSFLGDTDQAWLDRISGCIVPLAAVAVLWLAIIVTLIVALVSCRQAKRLAQAARDTDEGWEAVERKQSAALTATTVQSVIVYTCFGIGASGMQSVMADALDPMLYLAFLLADLVGLILSMASCIAIQRWVINAVKEQNPEKQGSVFQLNFNKVWIKSCDEAELSQIYRAGFKAYRAGHYACLSAWLVAVLGSIIGWMSWNAILLVGVIWIVLLVTYCVNCQKSSHGTIAF